MKTGKVAIAPVVVVMAGTLSGYQTSPPTRTWPPGVQHVGEQSPVLSPEAEMKTFFMPPGYRVELVASEPMIEEPVVIDWDPEGRLWVVEMRGYMRDMPATAEREPTGRVSVLEDTNDDGKMDRKTVFLDGLVLPRALKVLDRGVLIAEPPNLWLARDTDGDLRADTKELVTNNYGRAEANVEHNANGLLWALDNRMYTSETDMYLRLKNGRFEVQKTLSRGQWGVGQDDAGRIYRNSNESVLHVDIVPTPYFARNPALLRTRGSYESLRGEQNEVNRVWPVRPTRGVNRGYQAGILRADGTLASYTAAAAPTVYRGDRLPADLYGNVFVVDPAANLVSRIIIGDDGATLRARKAYERAEFLASTDERFRPVYLSNAPDGTLYVVDMYHGIIQHRAYITEYLRDQILARQLDRPIGYGRIYRVVHDTTKRDSRPSLSKEPAARLVERLGHPNGWWRDTAQRLLVERGPLEPPAVRALAELATSGKDPRTRLHALWTLDGVDAIEPAIVTQALNDESRDVRVSAIRVAERWLREPSGPIHTALLAHLTDPNPAVRRQLAASFGELPQAPRDLALAGVLERYGDDPIAVDAALSGLKGREVSVLERMLEASVGTVRLKPDATLEGVLAMLAATIVRRGEEAAIQTVLQWVAEDARPSRQRSALLRGAEVALLGAVPPGGGGRGRGGPSTSSAAGPSTGSGQGPSTGSGQGGRGGRGGAPAFPRTGRGGRGGTAMSLKLTREPALAAMAARDRSELAQRAAAVLSRIEWPGKPGAAAPATALSPEEQQRFAAGREVYQTLCAACHQPDGQGREKLAPSLIGSEFALAPAGVPIRIVLNGKEGTTGLMPPIGAALTDDQIAAALTYIRREWGHTAAPVDPATVSEIRTLTAGRSRPWTAEELSKIGTGPGGVPPR
jgi:mono/diheme cytochrome c family protein/glucose/arabinose dehydrogenase